MKNKIEIILLSLLFFILQFSKTVYAMDGDFIDFETIQSGTLMEEKEPCEYQEVSIKTEEDLMSLVESCRLDSWSFDKIVSLKNDIQLEKCKEIIIPSFSGIFEGNGYTIRGLKITETGSSLGFIRYLQKKGEVRNLNIEGEILPEGSRSNIGGIVGTSYGVVSQCSFYGTIKGDNRIGGIVGVNEQGAEVRNCVTRGNIIGNHSTGGIVGENHGCIMQCKNKSDINVISEEVAYELDDFDLEGITKLNSTENVEAHIDSGGIAGLSSGKIYDSINLGTVGYQHVGYNSGGIVGRLNQGYLENCINTGKIYGRKDVGGIVGQMEPFIEIEYLVDEFQLLDSEIENFLNLVDDSHENFKGTLDQVPGITDNITLSMKNIQEAQNELSNAGTDLWDIYNNELGHLNEDLKEHQKEEEEGHRDYGSLEEIQEDLSNHIDHVRKSTEEPEGIIKSNLVYMNQSMENVCSDTEKLVDILQASLDSTNKDVDKLKIQADIITSHIRQIRDDLFQFEGLRVEDHSMETEFLEDSGSQNNMDTMQKGKIFQCENKGSIEADTNVGGIVGQVATEYDFDPEDDIHYKGDESLNIEHNVKAVIRECKNVAKVIGKKDFVGGIVGRLEQGAVLYSESYGDVESINGNYVGGIAGLNKNILYCCYSMGKSKGKNYVGGIVGKGHHLYFNYAYSEIEGNGEAIGSIAGEIEKDGIISENYYVESSVGGVDGIAYEMGVIPLSYEEFCERKEVPNSFKEFTISFLLEGEEIATYHRTYGESIKEQEIPIIPPKEGYYGQWPEYDFGYITGNKVLEAQYKKWISTLKSDETIEGSPVLFVEGEFYPNMKLFMKETKEGIQFWIEDPNTKEIYDKEVIVHYLSEDSEDKVQVKNGDNLTRKGSYLIFHMSQPGIFSIEEINRENTKIWEVLVTTLVIIFIVLLLLFYKKKKFIFKRRK